MSNAGSALMGIGRARGEDRAEVAAQQAISSPLLEASMDGAQGVLLNISGGSDLGLFEINGAAELVAEAAHPEANIIFGAVIDDALGDEVRVTVIAAGFDSAQPDRRPKGFSGQQGYPQSRRTGPDGRVIDVRDEPRRAAAAPTTENQRPAARPATDPAARPAARPARYADDPRGGEQRQAEPRQAEPRAAEPRPAAEPQQRPERREPPARRVVFDDLDVPDFLK
jgi:cell division protein FtsZ